MGRKRRRSRGPPLTSYYISIILLAALGLGICVCIFVQKRAQFVLLYENLTATQSILVTKYLTRHDVAFLVERQGKDVFVPHSYSKSMRYKLRQVTLQR